MKTCLALILLLLFVPAVAAQPPDVPERDYWPTAGWRTANPEAQGMDSARLDAMHELILDSESNTTSVLVVRGGYLVFEHYYNGYEGDEPHQLRSVSKSVMSALLGIAIEQGFIAGVDAPIGDFLDGYFTERSDPRAAAITVQDLLTLRSGLLYTEGGRFTSYVFDSENWIAAALQLPLLAEPGEFWNYSSVDAHLLAGVLAEGLAAAEDERDSLGFADDVLFAPLGITDYEWFTDPQGNLAAGGGLTLTPRDLAKFGFLYLNNGWWDGAQIVPAEWVAASTAEQVMQESSSTRIRYGYLWWLADAGEYQGYAAVGFGGQQLYVFPDLDLLVVRTGDVDQDTGENLNLLGEYILPAILDAETDE